MIRLPAHPFTALLPLDYEQMVSNSSRSPHDDEAVELVLDARAAPR